MAEIQVKGLAELHKVLQNLPEQLEKKVLRNALRAGANEFKKAAQAQVPVKSGALRKSIRVKTSARKGRYRLKATVTAGNAEAWYSHLIEFGTGAYYTGSGKSVGKEYEIKPAKGKALFFLGMARDAVVHPGIQPQPFMRPAFDSGSEAAINAFAESVRKRLSKEGAL